MARLRMPRTVGRTGRAERCHRAPAGYPWRIRVDAVFELGPDGLSEHVAATNESADAAPFGVGGHPYLAPGPIAANALNEWTLELPAEEVLLVTPDRMLPTCTVKVEQHDGG